MPIFLLKLIFSKLLAGTYAGVLTKMRWIPKKKEKKNINKMPGNKWYEPAKNAIPLSVAHVECICIIFSGQMTGMEKEFIKWRQTPNSRLMNETKLNSFRKKKNSHDANDEWEMKWKLEMNKTFSIMQNGKVLCCEFFLSFRPLVSVQLEQ